MKVAVIGGGIAGLAAAWELVSGPTPPEVTVLEPGPLGGKLRTSVFAGHPVDEGADAFLARLPDGIRLCAELGIDNELVAPSAGKALVWVGGCLRELPEGLVLGVPGRLGPVLRSGLLSPAGMARAGLDLVLPATAWPPDLAVADLVARRLGRQVAMRLVDPLLGGIHAGSTEHLSVEATAPQLAGAARRSRSLLLALRHAAPPPGPTFLAPRTGMSRMVSRLVEALRAGGVVFEETAAGRLRREPDGHIGVEPAGVFDRVVLAVPAFAAGTMLAESCPAAAAELAAIPSASVTLVTLSYPRHGLVLPEGTSGILVPPAEGRLMTACSFGSLKWPQWSAPDVTVLRVSAGRYGDRRALDLADDELVARLAGEVAAALRTTAAPMEWRVSRWPGSFPQYLVGHLERVGRLERALAVDLPGVAVAGAAYRGAGIPACIASGRRAAGLVTAGDGPHGD
jgi:oxygen-dependent protoporphyrinogen oxidase